MPHLPNEIWLMIASYSEPKDLWLSLRPVNSQLQQCAEQYFKREVLPETTLILPVVIPTYDVRVPIRGKVMFNHTSQDSSTAMEDDCHSALYCMERTEPEYYRPHFLSRWSTMQDRESGRLDDRRVRWELELSGLRYAVSLNQSMAVKQGCEEGEARVSCDWRYLMTAFFRSCL